MSTTTTEIRKPFGDLTVGASMESPSRVITQELINQFAEISGDFNPVHVDRAFAEQTAYKSTIAHGALVLSVATGLASELGIAKLKVIFSSLEMRFVRAVKPGDSIRIIMTLKDSERLERQRAYQATVDVEIKNQNNKVTQEGIWILLIFD
jgi:3-hydroxybutyryl-CoA dehydratase